MQTKKQGFPVKDSSRSRVKIYGLKSAATVTIAKENYTKIKGKPKTEIFASVRRVMAVRLSWKRPVLPASGHII